MKIIVNLIDKMDDTLEEVEWYATQAYLLRTEHKSVADTYIKVADIHIGIYNALHDRVIELIEEEHRKGSTPPQGMIDLWKYEHEQLIKDFAEVKVMVDEYKKKFL